MGKFRVLVHGRGLVVRRFWFWRRRLGFYTTCYVEAKDAAATGQRAIELLRGDPKLVLAGIQAPTLAAEEVEEVPSFDGYPHPRTGLVFYPAGSGESARPVA